MNKIINSRITNVKAFLLKVEHLKSCLHSLFFPFHVSQSALRNTILKLFSFLIFPLPMYFGVLLASVLPL